MAMKMLIRPCVAGVVAAALPCAVFASTGTVPLPEPGTMSLLGLATAAAVIVARIGRGK